MTPKMALNSLQVLIAAVLALMGICPVVSAQNRLVTIASLDRHLRPKDVVCCSDKNLKTCNLIFINAEFLGKDTISLPRGIEVDFLNTVGDDPDAYHYGRNATDVIITFNPSTGGMHGHAMTSDGRSFVIENCGIEGHFWKEIDVELLGEDEGVDFVDLQPNVRTEHDALSKQSSMDTTTMVTYSVKIYYTPDFAANTPDIHGFIKEMIAETNQGYINSQVPLQISVHCIEQASINDVPNAKTMINNFAKMKSSVEELRGSADTAALLVNEFVGCGIGRFDAISSGITISASKKDCAKGSYTFGHEIGHNIGLTHDIDTDNNSAYPYGHGHLIAQGSASTGYRTIMAYRATNHWTRVNYYSNPNIIYSVTGTATGVAGISNNARLLIKNRMKLAAIGDESEACREGPSTSTTSSTTTTTTTTTTTSTTSTTSSPGSGTDSQNCPAGWSKFGSKCFKYLRAKKTPRSDRIKDCQNADSRAFLASIENEEELDFVRTLYNSRRRTVWIDGNDRAVEGNWKFEDGTALTYLNWRRGEPNDWKNQDCLTLRRGMFSDMDCLNRYRHKIGTICSFKIKSNCRAGWTEFGSKCFKYLEGKGAARSERIKDCSKEDSRAFLAKIETQEEQSFVKTLFDASWKSAWIDGNDRAREGTWVFEDGTPMKYLNWYRGGPNNVRDHDCLELWRGMFSDIDCPNRKKYEIGVICSYEPNKM